MPSVDEYDSGGLVHSAGSDGDSGRVGQWLGTAGQPAVGAAAVDLVVEPGTLFGRPIAIEFGHRLS